MNTKRPVNLDISTLSFPIMAIASILHRLSGIALFIMTPFLLCFLQGSLRSAVDFEKTRLCLDSFFGKAFVLLFLAALIYHLCAGIRHLMMDFGFGETVSSAKKTAWLLFAVSLIIYISVGVKLW